MRLQQLAGLGLVMEWAIVCQRWAMGLEGSLQRGDLCRKHKIDFVGSPKFCRKISGSSCILAPAFPHQESSDGLPTKSIYRQNLRESLRHLSVFRQKLSEDRIPRLLWDDWDLQDILETARGTDLHETTRILPLHNFIQLNQSSEFICAYNLARRAIVGLVGSLSEARRITFQRLYSL